MAVNSVADCGWTADRVTIPGSSTLVTSTMTISSPMFMVSSVALTVTSYMLSAAAAVDGGVPWTSPGISKSGDSLKFSTPLSIMNLPASVPSRDHMTIAPSGSVAVKVTTAPMSFSACSMVFVA